MAPLAVRLQAGMSSWRAQTNGAGPCPFLGFVLCVYTYSLGGCSSSGSDVLGHGARFSGGCRVKCFWKWRLSCA
jgi:hypothetical protein